MKGRRIGLVAGGGCVALAALALAVQPVYAVDTTVTFTVSSGGLTVDAPATAALGSGNPGGTIENSLGAVTVTDARGVAPAPWTATVSSTDFTSGTQTIPVASVAYWSGAAGSSTGDGTFTPGQLTRNDRVALGGPANAVTAFAHTGGTGGATVTWNPGLVVTVPITVQTGTYTGTVTHSVS